MKLVPFETKQGEFNVFAILEDTNIERLKKFDPAQIDVKKMGQPWSSMRLNTVVIGYCPPADRQLIDNLFARGQAARAIEFLSRGFEYRQDLGDTDEPYKSQYP